MRVSTSQYSDLFLVNYEYRQPLERSTAAARCVGSHCNPCPRYHQLFRSDRQLSCKACKNVRKSYEELQKQILRLIKDMQALSGHSIGCRDGSSAGPKPEVTPERKPPGESTPGTTELVPSKLISEETCTVAELQQLDSIIHPKEMASVSDSVALISGDEEMRRIVELSTEHSTVVQAGHQKVFSSECPKCSKRSKVTLCRIEKHYGIAACASKNKKDQRLFANKQEQFRKLVRRDIQQRAHDLMEVAKDRVQFNARIGKVAATRVDDHWRKLARSSSQNEDCEPMEPEDNQPASQTTNIGVFVDVPRMERDLRHQNCQGRMVRKDVHPDAVENPVLTSPNAAPQDGSRAGTPSADHWSRSPVSSKVSSSPPSSTGPFAHLKYSDRLAPLVATREQKGVEKDMDTQPESSKKAAKTLKVVAPQDPSGENAHMLEEGFQEVQNKRHRTAKRKGETAHIAPKVLPDPNNCFRALNKGHSGTKSALVRSVDSNLKRMMKSGPQGEPTRSAPSLLRETLKGVENSRLFTPLTKDGASKNPPAPTPKDLKDVDAVKQQEWPELSVKSKETPRPQAARASKAVNGQRRVTSLNITANGNVTKTLNRSTPSKVYREASNTSHNPLTRLTLEEIERQTPGGRVEEYFCGKLTKVVDSHSSQPPEQHKLSATVKATESQSTEPSEPHKPSGKSENKRERERQRKARKAEREAREHAGKRSVEKGSDGTVAKLNDADPSNAGATLSTLGRRIVNKNIPIVNRSKPTAIGSIPTTNGGAPKGSATASRVSNSKTVRKGSKGCVD